MIRRYMANWLAGIALGAAVAHVSIIHTTVAPATPRHAVDEPEPDFFQPQSRGNATLCVDVPAGQDYVSYGGSSWGGG